MKYIFLMLLFVCSNAVADVYIITDKNGSIYTASEKDDTIVPVGYTKQVIKGKLSDLPISNPATDYKYTNGKFSVDQDKVKAKEQSAKEEADAKAAKDSANLKLKALGLTDAEISAITGK